MAAVVALWVAWTPAKNTMGLDALTYIAVGIRMEKGDPVLYELLYPMEVPTSAGPKKFLTGAFLYHPLVATWYHLSVRVLDLPGTLLAQGVVGILLIWGGILAMGFSRRVAPAEIGLWLLVAWLSYAFRAGLHHGNIGPALGGLVLIGGVALLQRWYLLATVCFAMGSLVKPFVGIAWLALLIAWNPKDEEGKRGRLVVVGGWPILMLLLSMLTLIDTERVWMEQYVMQLLSRGREGWTLAFSESSLPTQALRWLSAWDREYYGQLVWLTDGPGWWRWKHPLLRVAQSVSILSLVAFLAVLWVRRSAVAEHPARIVTAALAAGFLIQPLNWHTNYAMLFLALGVLSEAPRQRLLALILLVIALNPSIYWVKRVLPDLLPPTPPVGSPELAAWTIARIMSLPGTAALLGLMALMLRGEGSLIRSHSPSVPVPRPPS